MSEFGVAIDVLLHNRQDIEDVIADLGGLEATLKLAAELLGPIGRIMQTVSKHSDPVAALETARQTILYYDEATRAKVRLFQEQYGLPVDGIVGNKTWGKVMEIAQ